VALNRRWNVFAIGPTERDLKRRRQRVRFFAASVALHLVTVFALVGGAVWRVPALAEPSLNMNTLPIFLPRATPPGAIASTPARAAAPLKSAPQTPQVTPRLAQPQEVPVLPYTVVSDKLPDDVAPDRPSGPTGPVGPSTVSDPGPGPVNPGSTGDGSDMRFSAQFHNPEIIAGTRIEPRYTEQARRIRLEGDVVLSAVVNEQGELVELRAVRGLPMGLTDSALDAVHQWRFRPATLAGRPVRAAFLVTIHFNCR
jgi:protein TonB